MTIDGKIRDEKLPYNIEREAAKIDKYEYLTGEEKLASNQGQRIKQAKFAYYPLGKAFEE